MKKFFFLLLIPFILVGCGSSKSNSTDKNAKERALMTLEKESYTFSYPEGYVEDTTISSDTSPYYSNVEIDARISVTPKKDFPKDTVLDDAICLELQDDVKSFDDDVILSNTSFTQGDIQGCDIQTTSPTAYDDHINYKLYYKTGDTVVYEVSINYPKDTPQIEIDNLEKAVDAFVIK